MKKVLYRCFWIWQYEDEERWLNEMSEQGWNLKRVWPFRYEFEQGGERQLYRLEYLPHFPGHPQSREYISFVEETGAKWVGSVKKWVYFSKPASEGAFDLFSNLDSRAAHLRRIDSLMRVCVILLLVCALFNLLLGVLDHSAINLGVGAADAAVGVGLFLGTRRLADQLDRMNRERSIRE